MGNADSLIGKRNNFGEIECELYELEEGVVKMNSDAVRRNWNLDSVKMNCPFINTTIS
jgi:hypothetical protein